MKNLLSILRSKFFRITLASVLITSGPVIGYIGSQRLHYYLCKSQHDRSEQFLEEHKKNLNPLSKDYKNESDLQHRWELDHEIEYHHKGDYVGQMNRSGERIFFGLGGVYVGLMLGGGAALWSNILLMTKEEREEFWRREEERRIAEEYCR